MSKSKKVFLIIYTLLLAIIAIFMINKILVASDTDSPSEAHVDYAWYIVKEDETSNPITEDYGVFYVIQDKMGKDESGKDYYKEIIAERYSNDPEDESKTELTLENVKKLATGGSGINAGINFGHLRDCDSVVCFDKYVQLQAAYSGQFDTGSGFGKEFIKKCSELTEDEKDALDRNDPNVILSVYKKGKDIPSADKKNTSVSWKRKLVDGKYVFDRDNSENSVEVSESLKTSDYFYSRQIEPGNLEVTHKTTDDKSLDWASAYILSRKDTKYPSGTSKDDLAVGTDVYGRYKDRTDTIKDSHNTKYTLQQWALWKVHGNTAGEQDNGITNEIDTLYPENGTEEQKAIRNKIIKLYEEAQAFMKYRGAADYGKPNLQDSNGKYKFKYVENGNYFIAGPININYGGLTASYNETSIDVRKIESYDLIGKDSKGNDITLDKTAFKFVNADGTDYTNLVTSKLDDSSGEIKFPESGKDFYIRIDNKSPIYSKNGTIVDSIREISKFNVKFKYLDVKADGFSIEDTNKDAVRYWKWEPKGGTSSGTGDTGDEYTLKFEGKGYDDPIPGVMHKGCEVYDEDVTFIKKYNEVDTEDCEASRMLGKMVTGDDGIRKEVKYIDHYIKFSDTGDSGDTGDTGGSTGGSGSSSTKTLERTNTCITTEWQPLFLFNHAEMFWRAYELEITFDEPEQPVYIDLGGKVWVDNPMDNGKVIDDADGIFNNNEWGRQNVLVELFFSDGTPVKVGTNGVVADDRNINLINIANGAKVEYNNTTVGYAMYTDENGDYKFYGLPVTNQYYVQFTYDGQTYTITKYLAGGDEEDYKKNPNQEKYDNNSKVKEETDRQAFNEKFSTIKYASIGTRGTGKALGQSASDLKYLDKSYEESEVDYIKSKIITTDNNRDAEYGETGDPKGPDKQTGKVIEPHSITERTVCIYPLNPDVLIKSANNDLDRSELHYLDHINLGLKFRQKADFQLSTQIKAGATTIKDKEKVVIYPQSAKKDDLTSDFTRQEDEYIKQEISAADYYWAEKFTDIYGSDGTKYYAVAEDKLHVYVLYRIAIKNQCEDANEYGIINEIIDYYDNGFERVPSNEIAIANKLFRKAGLKVSSSDYDSWIENTDTQVNWTDPSTVGNYQMMKSTTPITVEKGNSETAIYLMLKVKDNGDVLETGGKKNEQNGMQNIAEIGSYSVFNNGVNVGKIDKDSAPGNATPGENKTYEDDTDASPMFKLVINWTPKEIKGIVWDDSTNPTSKPDGEYDKEHEKGINGVTVKLVEHIVQEDGTVKEVERPGIDIVGEDNLTVNPDQSIKTGHTGKAGEYKIYVEGGNYSLKFIYGDEEMLQTNKKYNAQDYQATQPYNALSSGHVPGYNQSDKLKAFATNDNLVDGLKNFLVVGQEDKKGDLDWMNTNWNIGEIFADKTGSQSKEEIKGVTSTANKLSSARDKAVIRADIIRNTQELIYSKASILDTLNGNGGVSQANAAILSGGNTATPRHNYDGSGNYTYMEAVSDIIVIASNDLITEPNVINLGLKERPLASRDLKKQVDRIILTASDGTILVDTADNTKQSGLQNLDGNFQQTFINLEPRVMDGAKLDIYYTLTVTNDSAENDCLDNYVYVRKGRDTVTDEKQDLRNDDEDVLNTILETVGVSDLTSELPIRATIFDYVNINLEYRADDIAAGEDKNGAIWTKVYEESGNTGNSVNDIDDSWLSEDAKKGIDRTNKKVSKVVKTHTDKFDEDGLLKGEKVTIPIHLGITLSEDTSGKNLNDFDFSNCAEITQITTSAGRRDYDTVPGDYIPYDTDETNKKQPDAFLTGTTAITPPLGEGRFYYVIAIVSASIILVGIVLIKKKVLKK